MAVIILDSSLFVAAAAGLDVFGLVYVSWWMYLLLVFSTILIMLHKSQAAGSSTWWWCKLLSGQEFRSCINCCFCIIFCYPKMCWRWWCSWRMMAVYIVCTGYNDSSFGALKFWVTVCRWGVVLLCLRLNVCCRGYILFTLTVGRGVFFWWLCAHWAVPVSVE